VRCLRNTADGGAVFVRHPSVASTLPPICSLTFVYSCSVEEFSSPEWGARTCGGVRPARRRAGCAVHV